MSTISATNPAVILTERRNRTATDQRHFGDQRCRRNLDNQKEKADCAALYFGHKKKGAGSKSNQDGLLHRLVHSHTYEQTSSQNSISEKKEAQIYGIQKEPKKSE